MKLLLIAFTFACFFSSCGSNNKTEADVVGTKSSVSHPNNSLPDSSHMKALLPGNERTVRVEKYDANGSSTITTTTETNNNKNSLPKASTAKTSSTTNSTPTAVVVPAETKVAEKKGWSGRAKGAAIGGVGGAAAGALISKKKVEGALIGAAAGGAGGYIIGNEIDRKKANP